MSANVNGLVEGKNSGVAGVQELQNGDRSKGFNP
jgi:hypothetical protein